jgi:hypothetical protein
MPADATLLRPPPPLFATSLVDAAGAVPVGLADEVELEVELELELDVLDGSGNPTVVGERSSLSSWKDWLFAPCPVSVPGLRLNQQPVDDVKFRSSNTDPLYGAAGWKFTKRDVSVIHMTDGILTLCNATITAAECVEIWCRERARICDVDDVKVVEREAPCWKEEYHAMIIGDHTAGYRKQQN